MTARTPPVPPRYLGAAALALLVLLGAWYWLGSKPPPAKAPPAIRGRHRDACSARTCRCTSRDSAPCRPSTPSPSPRASTGRSTRSRSPKGRTSRRARCWCRSTRGPTRRRSSIAIATRAKDVALLANAQRDMERYTLLAPEDLASKQTVDTQRALIAQLVAQVKGDEARHRQRAHPARLHHHHLADRRAHRHPPDRSGQHRARERYDRHGGRDAARADRGHLHACPRSSSNS